MTQGMNNMKHPTVTRYHWSILKKKKIVIGWLMLGMFRSAKNEMARKKCGTKRTKKKNKKGTN